MKKYNLKIVDKVYSKYGNLSIGTSKNNKTLANIYTKAIKSLSKEQLDTLNKKWFSKKDKKSIFTKEELRYIQNSPKIITGITTWGSFVYIKNKKISGMIGDLLKRVEDISGLEFIPDEDTWPNLIKKIKNKKIDFIPTIFYTKEREKFGHFSQSYFKVKEFIYVNKDNYDINSLEDLNYKKVAIIKEFKSIKVLKKYLKNINIIETNNLEESILMLINNEVDAIYETQIAIEEKLNKLLISNLKTISQNKIEAENIHFFSKKNDLLLKSILQKSLYSISSQEKNAISSKWLNPISSEKKVNILFGKGREPYAFNKKYLKGIEYDLVEHILKMSNIYINKTLYLNLLDNRKALNQYKDFDVSVTIKEKKDNFYYSNNFISLNNIVVSRAEDNVRIDSIKDLRNKNIVAFQAASKYLNTSLSKLKIKTYKEEENQKKQVKDFLDKKSDLIILDINIFKWYLQKLSKQELSDFIFHDIFTEKNKFKVAFRNRNLRDIFNKNLKEIRDSGKYKEIVNEYLVNNIEKKIEVSSLISSILSKYILEENISEIRNIIKVFDTLPYINKIEVFTNNKNIYNSNDKTFSNHILQDSFFNFSNTPRKVGYIKIYFNNKHLKAAINNNILIPKIKQFINLSSYLYIKNIYTINLSQNNIKRFTKKEKDFIKNHKVIKYSTLNWEPVSIIEKDKISGIMHDYINIIEEETGLSFVYQKSKSWKELEQKFKTKKIDLFSKIGKLVDKDENTLISNEISHFHFAIVTREDGVFADEINDIEDKVIALAKGFPSYSFIKKNYPNIKIIETNTIKEALALVSQKKAYAFIAFTEVAIYNIKQYFPNLKIVGITENKFIHNFLIQEKYPELKSIINKVLSSISHKQKQDIRDKYIQNEINTAVNYEIIYQLLFIFIFILLIVLYFLKKLSKAKKDIEKKSLQMQEQKDLFEALFNGSSDGLTLIENNKLIDCNTALLKMYHIKDKKTLKNSKPGSLTPKYQENNILSSKLFQMKKEDCLKKGISNYEWLAKKTTGEIFWVNIILINIKTNNKNLIYSIIRDISKRKLLETEIKNRAKDLAFANEELEDSNEELQTSIQNLERTQNKLIESEKMASLEWSCCRGCS